VAIDLRLSGVEAAERRTLIEGLRELGAKVNAAPPNSSREGIRPVPKRALILAGGGLKVAWQAGVLQVWLDEVRINRAPLTFDRADGASGGVFNLAMYCQGLSGKEIADNWRNFPVLGSISLNWRQLLRLSRAESLFSYDKFRRVVLRERWKLDWEKIRSSRRSGTFNAYDFTHHRLVVRTQKDMDKDGDFLVAGVSLPGWFPPISIDGSLFIDAVYVTDANLIEAVAKGVDQLWIVWTVNRGGVWKGGFINTYFQIIEASANGNLNRDLARIHANNDAIDRGGTGEFGRRIMVEMIVGRVPLHYLINFSSHKFSTAVEQGVADAREWCRSRGYAFRPFKLWDIERAIAKKEPEHAPRLRAYSPIIDRGKFDPRVAPIAAHNERHINAPAERIWEILVRAANWPQWYDNAENVRIDGDGGGADLFLGAIFTWRTFWIDLRSEVMEFDPCRRIAWNAKSVGVEAYHAWVIEPTDGGCQVKTEETQYGFLALANSWLFPNRMHDGHARWLNGLACACARNRLVRAVRLRAVQGADG
jgi:predicted acylesterase/phospholipase RssA/uncharacterized protein YndB with AHSA1/START domain